MRRILITGGAGNVGGSLARRLVNNPDNFVLIVDNLLTGSILKLPDKKYTNWSFIKADINNWGEILPIMSRKHLDYVFHYAAVVGVQRILDNPMAVLKDIDGTKNILKISNNIGVKRVFFSSSSEVYGQPFEIPQNEISTPLNTESIYAIVKSVSESYCRTYQQVYGLDYTIFRVFNTYGPLQSSDFVVTKFIQKAIEGNDIEVYGDGSQTRTFCFVEDNIDVTLASIEGDYWINEVVNIGNDNEITILKLAETIIDVLNSKSKIKFIKPPLDYKAYFNHPEGDITRRKPDIRKMRKIFTGDLTSLKKGIELTQRNIINNFL